MGRPRKVHIHIEPREIGTLLLRGSITKRLYYFNDKVMFEADIIIGLTDEEHGKRIATEFRRLVKQEDNDVRTV